jgi:hypothetical protein
VYKTELPSSRERALSFLGKESAVPPEIVVMSDHSRAVRLDANVNGDLHQLMRPRHGAV